VLHVEPQGSARETLMLRELFVYLMLRELFVYIFKFLPANFATVEIHCRGP